MESKKSDYFEDAFLLQVLCGVLLFVIAMILKADFSKLYPYWWVLLLAAASYALANIFFLKALKTTEASEVVVITSTEAIWPVLGAFVIFKEVIEPRELIGFAIILLSVFVVSYKKSHSYFHAGGLTALLSGLFFGLGFLFNVIILKQVDVFTYLPICFLTTAFFIVLLKPNELKKLGNIKHHWFVKKMLPLIFIYTIATVMLYVSFQKGAEASTLAPLMQTTVISTVFLSALLLNERDNLTRKIIAAIMVCIGVFLLR